MTLLGALDSYQQLIRAVSLILDILGVVSHWSLNLHFPDDKW